MSVAPSAEIIQFWRNAGPDKWFVADETFDFEIRTRFLSLHEAAAHGAFASWEGNPQGALALLILCDQFPRNMFRAAPRAFATDSHARRIADKAIALGFDRKADELMRPFFYLPFMHSEALTDQDRSLLLFQALGDAEHLRHAVIHQDVIRRFGRFPHRNCVLGRVTTLAERRFLDEGGFAG
jgi:uncharacterized protein (DUF924 family)